MTKNPKHFGGVSLVLAGAWILTLQLACAQPPERVFVPGRDFHHVVEVSSTPATVRVGEWLTLNGRRRTGPWVEVERKSLGPDGCWVAGSPPAEEAEVADNLTWTSQPAETAAFNVGILTDHTRRVRFSAPGRYVLRASSATWCSPRVSSNELVVLVER